MQWCKNWYVLKIMWKSNMYKCKCDVFLLHKHFRVLNCAFFCIFFFFAGDWYNDTLVHVGYVGLYLRMLGGIPPG